MAGYLDQQVVPGLVQIGRHLAHPFGHSEQCRPSLLDVGSWGLLFCPIIVWELLRNKLLHHMHRFGRASSKLAIANRTWVQVTC